MELMNVGFFILKAGISLILLHIVLEGWAILKIKSWNKKNKTVLLENHDIYEKYNNEVLLSEKYTQLKELREENLFLVRKFTSIGLNYLDFLFFQGLIEKHDNFNKTDSKSKNIFEKLRKLILIMLLFEASHILKKVGYTAIKFSMVYGVVLFVYDKIR